MRTDVNEFIVRGRHAVFSPVQLPFWLPSDIMEKMLDIYKHILVQQITLMMSPSRVLGGRSRSNSLQSDAGLSNTSSDETSSSIIFGFPESS